MDRMKLIIIFVIIQHIQNIRGDPCSTDEDCYLRGECQNSKCICDHWAKGANCAYLNLAPADKNRQGYLNTTAGGYNSWGGRPIKVNNTYHLFAAEMENHCTLNGWTKVSQVVRAESTNHLGPYKMKQLIFPTFAHNPQITQAIDGTYLLYYIGVPNNQTTNCTSNATSNQVDNELITDWNMIKADDNTSYPWPSGGPIRLGWSKSIYGPWKTKTIVDSVEWHTSTNPSPYIYDNGTVLLVVARRWCDNMVNGKCTKNHKDTWLMYADEWNGTYKNISNQWNINHMNAEDPYIFRTKRGFHMLLHAGGPSEGFFGYSLDGINWTEVNIDSFNQNLTYNDGTNQQLCRRQRPQLLLDDNGEPMSLWTGAMVEGNCSNVLQSWTLAQPFVGYETNGVSV
eukprot:249728_1